MTANLQLDIWIGWWPGVVTTEKVKCQKGLDYQIRIYFTVFSHDFLSMNNNLLLILLPQK